LWRRVTVSAVKMGHHIMPPEGVKSERLLVTLCRHGAVPP